MIGLLLERKVPVDVKNTQGYTALAIAVRQRNVPILTLLFDKKIPVDSGALMCSPTADIAEFLITKGADIHERDAAGNTILHKAAQQNWHTTVNLLLENEMSINVKGANDMSPLMCSGNEAIAEFLIKKDADITAKRDNEDTILHIAASKGWNKVLDLLLQRMHIDTPGAEDRTALMCASSEQIATLLIEKNANIHTRDSNQNTVLHEQFSKDGRRL